MIAYFDDTSGYLAKSVVNGNYPGVVMIHEWWELNDNIKEMADKLASHGYVVLAVDLYDGKVATTSDQVRQLIALFDPKYGIQNMNSAVSLLNDDYSANSIGSIGWCFGDGQSLNLALDNGWTIKFISMMVLIMLLPILLVKDMLLKNQKLLGTKPSSFWN